MTSGYWVLNELRDAYVKLHETLKHEVRPLHRGRARERYFTLALCARRHNRKMSSSARDAVSSCWLSAVAPSCWGSTVTVGATGLLIRAAVLIPTSGCSRGRTTCEASFESRHLMQASRMRGNSSRGTKCGLTRGQVVHSMEVWLRSTTWRLIRPSMLLRRIALRSRRHSTREAFVSVHFNLPCERTRSSIFYDGVRLPPRLLKSSSKLPWKRTSQLATGMTTTTMPNEQ